MCERRVTRSSMKTRGFLLWLTMSLLVFSSVVSIIYAQENPNEQRLGDSFKLKEQQQSVESKGARYKWRLSPVAQRRRRDGNGIAQQCAADLFALFGGPLAASHVEKSRAKELLDCVRVLAPDLNSSPLDCDSDLDDATLTDEELQEGIFRNGGEKWRNTDFKKKISSPPAAVRDLASKTVEWGGDPTVVMNALGPKSYPVPDVEGSTEQRCTLTKYDDGRRFAKQDITKYMAFLFETIAELSPSVGLNISLNRFDLFHGHMFTAYNTGRLGILFHSREYPAYDENKFPLNLGYCQKGSTLPYDASMALRNIVWLAPMPDCSPVINSSNQTCSKKWLAPGSLFVLDTAEGKILDRELVPDYLDVVHTVSEDDLGDVMLDVNYFSLANNTPEERIFLC
ncbi:unnamed protein product [Calypogeia fissa]